VGEFPRRFYVDQMATKIGLVPTRRKGCGIDAIVSRRAGFSPYLARAHDGEMSRPMLAPSPRSGALWTSNFDPFSGEELT
jgi:hypothetical protein